MAWGANVDEDYKGRLIAKMNRCIIGKGSSNNEKMWGKEMGKWLAEGHKRDPIALCKDIRFIIKK